MTTEDIISLGWKEMYSKRFIHEENGFDYRIMSMISDNVLIKCVPQGTTSNIWDNSETHFYG